MIRKLCTLLLLAAFAAPVLAQQTSGSKKEGVVFAPQKGQWQFSLVLGGNGSNFYNENTSYLLPNFTNTGGSVGIGGASYDRPNMSNDPDVYLNINGLNYNSMVNIIGLQAKYFISDCWDINLSFSMDINVTPKKDYVEGDYVTVPDMIIPAQRYINAKATNNWYVSVGTNRYFKTSNARIHPYVGVLAGFQMARIETNEPYTGETYDDEYIDDDIYQDNVDDSEDLPTQIYLASGKAGQMFGIKGAAVAGIEYSIAKGLVLGLELQPVAYRYDVIQICPKGFDKYNASHHNIKLFDMPVLKLGFRF